MENDISLMKNITKRLKERNKANVMVVVMDDEDDDNVISLEKTKNFNDNINKTIKIIEDYIETRIKLTHLTPIGSEFVTVDECLNYIEEKLSERRQFLFENIKLKRYIRKTNGILKRFFGRYSKEKKEV